MPEPVVQVGLQICGNDTVVTMAVEGAELGYNAWTAVIAKNLFESAPLFTDKCLRGLQVRAEHTRATAVNTLSLSTVVGGVYGYDAGARAAYRAVQHGSSIADAVVALGIASHTTADRLLDPGYLRTVAGAVAGPHGRRGTGPHRGPDRRPRARSPAGRVPGRDRDAQADSQLHV